MDEIKTVNLRPSSRIFTSYLFMHVVGYVETNCRRLQCKLEAAELKLSKVGAVNELSMHLLYRFDLLCILGVDVLGHLLFSSQGNLNNIPLQSSGLPRMPTSISAFLFS